MSTRARQARPAGPARPTIRRRPADYFLSKRTDVCAMAVYQRASGTDSLGQPAVAYITGQSPSSNNHQIAVRLGIAHRF